MECARAEPGLIGSTDEASGAPFDSLSHDLRPPRSGDTRTDRGEEPVSHVPVAFGREVISIG